MLTATYVYEQFIRARTMCFSQGSLNGGESICQEGEKMKIRKQRKARFLLLKQDAKAEQKVAHVYVN